MLYIEHAESTRDRALKIHEKIFIEASEAQIG
jgi:hypothetical protein